jgi:hypothetical protein
MSSYNGYTVYNLQVEEDEMGGPCSTNGGDDIDYW